MFHGGDGTVAHPGTACLLRTAGTNNVGSESPKGNGKYGQADLAGNLWEWNLDWYVSPYVVTGNNCSYLPASSSNRMIRGGTFTHFASPLLASYRYDDTPTDGYNYLIGARCARSAP